MEMWLTADLHFGHANIIRYSGRPYADVDAMNEDLIDRWNSTVARGDLVWVLGDWALGRRAETLPIARRLHGMLHLIPGNHDACWPGHRGHARAVARYLDAGFTSVLGPRAEIQIAGRTVLACHFPYVGTGDHERFEERYSGWRPADSGGWLLHGHIHEAWRTRGRQINVGVDAWAGRPVPLETIESYVRADEPVTEPPLPWR